jgi:hypothetical protein
MQKEKIMNKNIASIINYCSNDYPFLEEALFQVRKFSHKVIVVVADHLFDGEKENLKVLEKSFSAFDFATFIIYPFIPDKIPRRILKKVKKSAFWHSLSRAVGAAFIRKEIDYLFFLDMDEIVDGDRFSSWLKEKKYIHYNALRFSNYWYFRSPSFQATTWEDSPLLVKRKKLKAKFLLDSRERDAIFDSIKEKKERGILGLDHLPMIHHYSWVKSKKQMLKKVGAWGHKNERNWQELVEKEFESPNSKKDFVHGYDLINVNPFVEIDLDKSVSDKEEVEINKKNNIIYLSEKELLKIIWRRSFKDYLHCCLERVFGRS